MEEKLEVARNAWQGSGGTVSKEDSKLLSDLAAREDEAGRCAKEIEVARVEQKVSKLLTVESAKVVAKLLGLARVTAKESVEAATATLGGDSNLAPRVGAIQALKNMAGAAREALGRSKKQLCEDLDGVIADGTEEELGDAELALVLAEGVVRYVKMDREESHGLALDVDEARKSWKTAMTKVVLKAGLGKWPIELQAGYHTQPRKKPTHPSNDPQNKLTAAEKRKRDKRPKT
mmetsp:Transcript_47645/g.94508  ORF Transcript_47645/g.94508 Transcript_47645/m.94508 type:complete len:233 (+) Transcript_47645:228-926(+)